jgi:hypothetical protein
MLFPPCNRLINLSNTATREAPTGRAAPGWHADAASLYAADGTRKYPNQADCVIVLQQSGVVGGVLLIQSGPGGLEYGR